MADATTSVKIHHDPHSDHALLAMKLGRAPSERGPGLWRFDVHLLTDNNFTEKMTEFLNSWHPPEELTNPNSTWEWLKFVIKRFVIEYQTKNKSESAQLIKDLRHEFQTLSESQSREDEQILARLDSIKRELKEIEQEAANRIIFRSKCKWARLGEKPTKYFLNLEKQRSKENVLATIINDKGIKINKQVNAESSMRGCIHKIRKMKPLWRNSSRPWKNWNTLL